MIRFYSVTSQTCGNNFSISSIFYLIIIRYVASWAVHLYIIPLAKQGKVAYLVHRRRESGR